MLSGGGGGVLREGVMTCIEVWRAHSPGGKIVHELHLTLCHSVRVNYHTLASGRGGT